MSLYRNFFILLISGIFLIGQWGCVTSPIPPSLEGPYRQQLGRIGVVTARFVPKAEFAMPHTGYLERVGQDTMEGLMEGVRKGREGGGGPAHPAYIVLAFLAEPIVGGLGGGLLGGIKGAVYEAFTNQEFPHNIEETSALLQQALTNLRLQESFRDVFLNKASTSTVHDFSILKNHGPQRQEDTPRYEELSEPGLDAIVELSVQSIGFVNGAGGKDPPLALSMSARVRIINLAKGEIWYDQIFTHRSKMYPYSEWAMYQAERFQNELSHGYQDLAMHMIPSFLEMRSSSIWASNWPSEMKTVPFTTDPYLLQPTLQWEVFGHKDLAQMGSQVTDITYDIQIWDGDAPTDPVYVRSQIPSIVHTVDTPLKPCHTYLWNLRAAFLIDGSPRVTSWTFLEKPKAVFSLSESCATYFAKKAESFAKRADFKGSIIDVTEGNMFSIQSPTTVERVQLRGISCPEANHPFRDKSKSAILALGKNVAAKVLGEDKEGHKVGELMVLPIGQALEKELIQSGLCWWDWRYPEKVNLEYLEIQTKRAKRGIWEDIRD